MDTLTTQLKPTAAGMKKIHTVDTYMYHFHKLYFQIYDAEHKKCHISNFQLREPCQNVSVVAMGFHTLHVSHPLSHIYQNERLQNETLHINYLHKFTLGILCECHISLRLVTRRRPASIEQTVIIDIEQNQNNI